MELKGQLDTFTASQVEQALDKLISKRQFRIVIDLGKVNYVSSAGWGIFLGILKEVKLNKGDLRLCGMTHDVTEVFKLLQMEFFLPTYETWAEAARSF